MDRSSASLDRERTRLSPSDLKHLDNDLARLSVLCGSLVQRTEAVTAWDEEILLLVHTISSIFRNGLKRSLAQKLVNSQPSFWQFVREISLPATISKMRHIAKTVPLFQNQMERENLWVIISLAQGDLSSYVLSLSNNMELVNLFYSDTAYLQDPSSLEHLHNDFLTLTKVKFELSNQEYIQFLKTRAADSRSRKDNDSEDVDVMVFDTSEIPEGKLYSPVPMFVANASQLEGFPFSFESTLAEKEATGGELAAKDDSPERSTIEFDVETSNINVEKDQDTKDSDHPWQSSPMIETDIVNRTDEPSRTEEEGIESFYSSTSDLEIFDSSSAGQSFSESSRDDRRFAFEMDSETSVPKEESPILGSLPADVMEEGREELKRIMERPRSSKIAIVDSGNDSTGFSYPVLVTTPKSDLFEEQNGLVGGTPRSITSEIGFFGIPLSLENTFGVYDLILSTSKTVAGWARWILSQPGIIEDEPCSSEIVMRALEEEMHQTSLEHEHFFQLDDSFHFELTKRPVRGLKFQDSVCIQCQRPLKENELDSFRICDITGKYYCIDCFGKDSVLSPARIVQDWNFEEQPVAESIATEYREHFSSVLLNLDQLAASLFERVQALRETQRARQIISMALFYIKQCSGPLMDELQERYHHRLHLIEEYRSWTIDDLVALEKGQLATELASTEDQLTKHIIRECNECRAMAEYCVICQSTVPIYRFEIDSVTECPRCHTLSHSRCLNMPGKPRKGACVNCERVFMSVTSPSIDPVVITDEY